MSLLYRCVAQWDKLNLAKRNTSKKSSVLIVKDLDTTNLIVRTRKMMVANNIPMMQIDLIAKMKLRMLCCSLVMWQWKINTMFSL